MLSEYIAEKIVVFCELGIKLTDEQIKHIMELKTEIAIDNYCRDLILLPPKYRIRAKQQKAS